MIFKLLILEKKNPLKKSVNYFYLQNIDQISFILILKTCRAHSTDL